MWRAGMSSRFRPYETLARARARWEVRACEPLLSLARASGGHLVTSSSSSSSSSRAASRHGHRREHLDVVVVAHAAHDVVLERRYRRTQLDQRVLVEHERDDLLLRHDGGGPGLVRQQSQLPKVRAGAVTAIHPVIAAAAAAASCVAPLVALQRHRGALQEDVERIALVALPHDLRPGLKRHARAPRRQRVALPFVELGEERHRRQLAPEPLTPPPALDLVRRFVSRARGFDRRGGARRRELERRAVHHEARRGRARGHHRRRPRLVHQQRLLAKVVAGAEASAGRARRPTIRLHRSGSRPGGRRHGVVDPSRASGPLPARR
mmetsp:Transcript_9335/g.38145  ORF Transcript_9335/g.38145 Transcript_9335/m.38145 type:complete len:322 (-) Transcript_9335:33-998(-)